MPIVIDTARLKHICRDFQNFTDNKDSRKYHQTTEKKSGENLPTFLVENGYNKRKQVNEKK